MKRATITVPSELEQALEAYRRDQEIPPALTAIAQAALREYLAGRGYLSTNRKLRISPAPTGSGDSRGSIDHDRILSGM